MTFELIKSPCKECPTFKRTGKTCTGKARKKCEDAPEGDEPEGRIYASNQQLKKQICQSNWLTSRSNLANHHNSRMIGAYSRNWQLF